MGHMKTRPNRSDRPDVHLRRRGMVSACGRRRGPSTGTGRRVRSSHRRRGDGASRHPRRLVVRPVGTCPPARCRTSFLEHAAGQGRLRGRVRQPSPGCSRRQRRDHSPRHDEGIARPAPPAHRPGKAVRTGRRTRNEASERARGLGHGRSAVGRPEIGRLGAGGSPPVDRGHPGSGLNLIGTPAATVPCLCPAGRPARPSRGPSTRPRRPPPGPRCPGQAR